jgi:hypothetical protein
MIKKIFVASVFLRVVSAGLQGQTMHDKTNRHPAAGRAGDFI